MDTVDYLLTDDSPKATQPEEISIPLKPHQLASLYRMCMLDRDCGMTMRSEGIQIRSNVAILADFAGYGKTLSFLALVQELKSVDTQWMPQAYVYVNEGYGVALTKNSPSKEYIDTTLVVVPDNLIDHWQMHIERYTQLEYETVVAGSYNKILIEEYDLILCPASHYNNFVRANKEYYWNRVAFDEADSINIPKTEKVNSRFLWFITATFDNIYKRKNTGFIKNLFRAPAYWDNPIKNFFYPVVVKGVDEFVKKSFALVEPRVQIVDCLTPNFIKAVHQYVSPKILELISAGDIDSAIVSLGGNVDSDRNIIKLVTRNFNAQIEGVEKELQIENIESTQRDKLTATLKSLETRRDALKESISNAENGLCIICYENLKHPTLVSCCNNMFCAKCLVWWLKDKKECPLCRAHIEPAALSTISHEPVKPMVGKTKIESLIDIIRKDPDGRYIIFSGHQGSFRDITKALDHCGVIYGVLTTARRSEVVLDKFRDGQLPVILLDAGCNGAGIEMQIATDVILYHQMRTSLEIQAIARAQRPGRVGQLRVWKLRYEHEY